MLKKQTEGLFKNEGPMNSKIALGFKIKYWLSDI